ncbi:MAG TPA: YciI family protein [Alphaproteobacteria bacterium]|nr:YciI family protein [Alphaproteobacteria bacterium]
MHFFIHCVDKPDHGAVRAENRAAHLEHLERHRAQIVAAGPTQTDDLSAMTGSVLLMDFPDRAAAEAFCREDPYAKAGLFRSVTITPWKLVYPKG